jgi:hypothetical protein
VDTWACTMCQWDKRKVSIVGPDEVIEGDVDPPEGATRHCRCGDSCAMWAREVK